MLETISRRTLFNGALAASVAAAFAAEAKAAPPAQRLSAETAVLEVNGRAGKVFRLLDGQGRRGIRLAPDERFRVDLANRAAEKTIIHWHGQLPPWTQDGFPWPQTPPLSPGVVESYDYAPIPGTFWMHSHQGLQEQSLMTAPLIVRSTAELREDRQEVVLMLDDFSFTAPDELLARLTGGAPSAVHTMARRTEAVPAPARNAPAPGMSMGGMPMSSMTPQSIAHGAGMAADLNDIDYDAFLANDRTLADPGIVRVERSGRVRLRIINGASASQFWIDLGALSGRVVATDGHPVRSVAGRRFPLAIAQRLDILLDLPATGAFPIFAQVEGTRHRTGIVLATKSASVFHAADAAKPAPPVDNSLEERLTAMRPLPPRPADLRHRIVLSGGMKPYSWSLNGEYWPHITPLMLERGQRVEIDLVNHSMMAHPMHLHGHAFQVIAVNSTPIRGAVRDTVLVTPMMGSVRIAFNADNPGRWAFHCHNLYHMMTGMMTEFRYRGVPA
ncbi:multicopper oxidase family protein [Acidiphilium multivorum]|uniref:multicopper oxidase family protein n=1 Tax=Acidiphilium multivorum TaxID=62140 RepID=UPI0039C8E53B